MIFNHTNLDGKENINNISYCNNGYIDVYINAF